MFAGLALAAILAQANAEQVPATLLIWGGGKTRAEADASLAAFRAASKEWPYFKWEPGWPRVLESVKVPGLKPGFFIAVLGACFPPEAEPLLGVLKVLEPSVYAKPVTWATPLPCPQHNDSWSWGSAASWKSKTVELVAVPIQHGESKLVIAARATQKTERGVTSNLRLLDAEACEADVFLSGKRGLTMDTTCVTGRCTTMGHSSIRIVVTAEGGTPGLDSTVLKVIDTASCD